MSKKTTSEIRLLTPQRAPLTPAQEREAVTLLAEVLTTAQLTLLFFSSKRRAQDRLLFLYRQRVVDRFYPPSRFGAGKPQAHWLLDEAGALLVAATLGVERKQTDAIEMMRPAPRAA